MFLSMRIFSLLPALALAALQTCKADIQKVDGVYWLTGAITQSDAQKARRIMLAEPEKFWFVLNSTGGDLASALEIGRMLRQAKSHAVVSGQNVCLSACVLVLAGAVQRTVWANEGARVGVHRPYEPEDQALTMDAQKARQGQWHATLKSFFREVNLPQALFDLMINTPPGEIRLLSPKELLDYGLGRNDLYWQDAQDTRNAKEYGLNKMEYLARQVQARRICPPYVQWTGNVFADSACEHNIMRGLPPSWRMRELREATRAEEQGR
jgi:hypothetical protein